MFRSLDICWTFVGQWISGVIYRLDRVRIGYMRSLIGHITYIIAWWSLFPFFIVDKHFYYTPTFLIGVTTTRIRGHGTRSYTGYGITSHAATRSALGRSRVLIGTESRMSTSERYKAPRDSLHINRMISPIDIIMFHSHHNLIKYYSLTTSSLILL